MVASSDNEEPRPRPGGRAVLIAGPTASGKSAVALAVARRIGGVVVNADSMQVYRDLRLLTARPEPAVEAAAPHRLYGHVDGAINYSAARYLADASALVAVLRQEGLVPVFVGGTGLYFKALTEGLSDIPPVPAAIRARTRAEAEGRPSGALYADLMARDPETAARLRPSDRLRVLRALEVFAATGRPLASFQGSRIAGPLAGHRLARIFLAPDRPTLRARIDARFVAMVDGGALDEVRRLRERHLDPALPVMRAHGVPALLAHLAGELTLGAAIARGKADTRAYVKRQFTWFRGQMPGFVAVDPEVALEAVISHWHALAD